MFKFIQRYNRSMNWNYQEMSWQKIQIRRFSRLLVTFIINRLFDMLLKYSPANNQETDHTFVSSDYHTYGSYFCQSCITTSIEPSLLSIFSKGGKPLNPMYPQWLSPGKRTK